MLKLTISIESLLFGVLLGIGVTAVWFQLFP